MWTNLYCITFLDSFSTHKNIILARSRLISLSAVATIQYRDPSIPSDTGSNKQEKNERRNEGNFTCGFRVDCCPSAGVISNQRTRSRGWRTVLIHNRRLCLGCEYCAFISTDPSSFGPRVLLVFVHIAALPTPRTVSSATIAFAINGATFGAFAAT